MGHNPLEAGLDSDQERLGKNSKGDSHNPLEAGLDSDLKRGKRKRRPFLVIIPLKRGLIPTSYALLGSTGSGVIIPLKRGLIPTGDKITPIKAETGHNPLEAGLDSD